jgi:hypothetical protein
MIERQLGVHKEPTQKFVCMVAKEYFGGDFKVGPSVGRKNPGNADHNSDPSTHRASSR